MTAIVDYGAGNIKSVTCALARLGEEFRLTDDPAEIAGARRVLLPGVGNAAKAVSALREKGLCEVIKGLRKPVLGICVGMQILCRNSEEDGAEGLGIFDCSVRRFPRDPGAKVPHMGWNVIANMEGKLFKGVPAGASVYFVHSYAAVGCDPSVIARTEYGGAVTAAVAKGNVLGCQFHPEKSGALGLRILKAFCEIKEGEL